MGHFERDTAVEPDGELAFTCRIEPGWWVVAGPNGGYIGAILSRALAAVGGERPAAMAMAVLADDREESLGFDRSEPPEVSPPEELEPTPRPKELPPFGGHFDYRFALGPPPFSGARTPSRAAGCASARSLTGRGAHRCAHRLLAACGVHQIDLSAGGTHVGPHSAPAWRASAPGGLGAGALSHPCGARGLPRGGRRALVARRRAAGPVAPARPRCLASVHGRGR